MADTSKEKIIKINTQSAEKGVKTLKQQIKELRDQLGTLEKGTEEYDRVAKQLADTNQRQIEVNEAMKYSNQDVGATFTNLTRVATGVVGAINGVNAVMTMMGADGEEAAEALKKIQLTMAVIQGMNAMVEATKSLHGLGVAFGIVGNKAQASETQLKQSVTGTTGAITRETASLKANTAAKTANTGATKTMAAAEKGATTSGTKLSGVLSLLGGGIKKVGAAIKSFMVSNPFTALLTAAVAVVGIFAKIKNAAKEAEKNTKAVGQALASVKMAEWDALFNGGTTALAKARAGINKEFEGIYNDAVSWTTLTINTMIDETKRGREYEEDSVEWLEDVMERRREKANEANAKDLENYETWLATREDKDSKMYQILMEGQKKAQQKFHTVNIAFYDQELKALDAMLNASGDQIDAETRKIIADRRKEIYNLRNEEAKAYNAAESSYNEYLKSLKKEPTTTNTVKKSIKELIELFKELRKEILNTNLSFESTKSAFNGFYDETEDLLRKIKNIIKINSLDTEKMVTQEFLDAVNGIGNDLTSLSKYDVTLDYIFGVNKVEDLKKQLSDAEKLLNQYVNQEIKVTEKAEKIQRKRVQELKNQVTVYSELADAVVNYLKKVQEVNDKYGETATKKRLERLEQEKQLYLTYWADVIANNPWAELNNDLLTTETQLDNLKKEMQELADEEARITPKSESDPNAIDLGRINKETHLRLDEIADRRMEIEEEIITLERNLEETNHSIRMKHIEDEYEARKENAEAEVQNLHNERSAYGGGTEDYNTERDALRIQLKAIEEQAKYVEQYYNDVMATVTRGSDEWVQLEIEKQAALTQLEEDGAKKRAEITQAEVDRKKKIQQTYMNSLTAVTSQISSLLGEKMNAYDQDSKEYKKLQIAQATINTLSGTLAAFVSGFQSGIPWPGNLILAGVLSGLTFATGLTTIENIKKESLKNSSTSSATSGSFGEYDTLTYMNDVDLIDSIQDQRVYVTENDITSTQNRVQVRESEATF